jgi:signal transduction histidine kinase/CheY-like chemotaxis protein
MGMRIWNRDITTKVASSFLLLALLSVGVVGGVAFVRAREALKAAAFDRLRVSATLKEQEIARWFEDQQRDFLLITQFPDIQRDLRLLMDRETALADAERAEIHQQIATYLTNVSAIKPSLSEIFILDRRNRVVVSSRPNREGQYTILASVTYFEEVEAGETFDPIFYVSQETGKPTVTLASPLRNAVGDREGAILAHLNLAQIDQIVRERTGLGDTGEAYLVGSLVNESTFISKENPLGEAFSGGVSSLGIDSAMRGRSGSDLYTNYANVPVIGVYRWLNDQDIALLVEMHQEEAFAPAQQLAVTIMLVGLVSVGGLALGVRWLARQLQFSREQLERYSQQLEQKAQEANAANQAKSEFLANMSHELRTPLNAILGFTQLMSRDRAVSLMQLEQLKIINRSGEHLLTLINDVLEMSKIEAGRTTLNENTFNLHALLESIEEMFRLKAQSQGLHLAFEQSADLPLYVRTDEGKLRQVLINLISNAIKFTPQGSVTVRSRLLSPQQKDSQNDTEIHPEKVDSIKRSASHDNTLRFDVEDTGAGIAFEELEHLFEPFAQTESGRKSKQGTGLGLPISQKFVDLMGGAIQVHSTPEQGSLFSFTVQVQSVSEPESLVPPTHRRVIGLAPNQPRYRILIVEDRWENRQLLSSLLVPIGFEVREAVNGQEAIALWEAWEPHLIWMDMRMPVMDGYEATKQIRAHIKGHATAIIALTASAFEESRSIILAAGCNDFVRKPFQDEVIFAKMAQYLGVQYLYNEESMNGRSPQPLPDFVPNELQPEQLRVMPEIWIDQLHQEALKVNAKGLQQLLQQIPDAHTDLRRSLLQSVQQFQFEAIVELAQAALKHPRVG